MKPRWYISGGCKSPKGLNSRNLQMHPYNSFDENIVLSPPLESGGTIFHILKGTPQEVKAETTSLINLCSLMQLIKGSLENRWIICAWLTPWVRRFVNKITCSQISGYAKPLLPVTSS